MFRKPEDSFIEKVATLIRLAGDAAEVFYEEDRGGIKRRVHIKPKAPAYVAAPKAKGTPESPVSKA